MNQLEKFKLVQKKFEPEVNLNHNIYNHQNELAESVNFNSICAINATVIVVYYVSFLNLSRSINETTSIIKIF